MMVSIQAKKLLKCMDAQWITLEASGTVKLGSISLDREYTQEEKQL